MAISKATASSVAPAAKGDLVVGSGTNDAAVLAVGTNGYTLVADSSVSPTGLKWATGASGRGVKLRLKASQSIANATATAVSFSLANSEGFDTDAYHDLVTNPTRITIPTGLGGYYLIMGTVSWQSSTTGYREVWIQKGASGRISQQVISTGAQGAMSQYTFSIESVAAGDYFQMYCEQNSGGALNALGNTDQETRFEAIFLGA